MLDISALGVTSANFSAHVSISQLGDNVIVTIDGSTITLLGQSAANITTQDFLLGGP